MLLDPREAEKSFTECPTPSASLVPAGRTRSALRTQVALSEDGILGCALGLASVGACSVLFFRSMDQPSEPEVAPQI